MATIDWAHGISGSFTNASDWLGGVVPGAADTAVIDASAGAAYTVTVGSATLAGLVLDASRATLLVTGALNVGSFNLAAGTLQLDAATLSGTITETHGKLALKGRSSNLNDVTWQGALDPKFATSTGTSGVLISNGLTLTGVGGKGPGSATFGLPTYFNNVSSLDNATITLDSPGGFIATYIENTSTLTLGSKLNLTGGFEQTGGGQVTNDGVWNNASLVGEGGSTFTLVNNGTISGVGGIIAGTFINNGLVDISAGGTFYLDAEITTVGAQSSIDVSGSVLLLSLGTSLTTAQFLAEPSALHVDAGSAAIAFDGTIDNTGATLTTGTGTALGTALASSQGTIMGGVVVDTGGQGTFSYLSLTGLTYESASPTLNFYTPGSFPGDAYDVLTNVTLTGVSTIDVGLQSGGLDVGGSLALDGVSIGGLGGSSQVTMNLAGDLELGAGQTIAGYTINVNAAPYGGTIVTQGAVTLDDATINFESFEGGLFRGGIVAQTQASVVLGPNLFINGSSGMDFDLEGNVQNNGYISGFNAILINISHSYDSVNNAGTISVAPGGSIVQYGALTNSGVISASSGGAVALQGVVANSGTIAVAGGTLELTPSQLTNTGSIGVNNGTLVLDGSSTLAELTAIGHSGSGLVLNGALDLGGGTLTVGGNGQPTFVTVGPSAGISDGSLAVKSGDTLTLNGLTYNPPSLDTVSATLVNNGVVNISPSGSYDASYAAVSGNISGIGTVTINTGIHEPTSLLLSGTVGGAQTIQFAAAQPSLASLVLSGAAVTGFAAHIAGFTAGESIQLTGETVTSAQFSGAAIVAQLSGGGSITLKTTTALTGSLTVTEASGNATLTYASTTPALQDWSAADLAPAAPHAAVAPASHFAGPATLWGLHPFDLLLAHHPQHV